MILELAHIQVKIEEKSIIKDFSHTFRSSLIYALLGENGSGKSSLAFSIFSHPRYEKRGSILLDDEEIISLSPHELARRGMFLSFQNVPEIPGIRLIEYLRTIYNHEFIRKYADTKPPTPFVFRRMVEKMLPDYGIDPKFLDRDLYVGFSGGEKRRIEMLQIALLDPSVIVLDEIDAGLDIGALDILRKEIIEWQSRGKIIIVISHNFHLLDTIAVDEVIIMKDGTIERYGTGDIIQDIRKNGF